ncbi:MAG: benzoyl-CoA-dihydrodiol lyase [Alphaproteobacteria bacterium]|nr:benzoyl-CoA-dihydrodiol lyase [Alphaproteobacteria bacterium]
MAKGIDTPVSFETRPYDWTHWQLTLDGDVATLSMNVQEDQPMRPGYELKLNSYDLGVDIELYDAVNRMRFEHPEVRAVVVTSATDRVFCAGANIHMLASSTHAFKVNFCKFTNETRCSLEEPGSPTYIAAVNGACAGGGYELALACDAIYLIDDGSSTVSLPEVPLLGVLPGTGGLTRLTDKRKVRRDLADVFCTKAEGFKSRDALRGRLIDGAFPRSKWDESVARVARAAADSSSRPTGVTGITLNPLDTAETDTGLAWEHVRLDLDNEARTATLTVSGPTDAPPATHEALHALGDTSWALAAFRQLERALLELRFNHPTLGLILLRTTGDQEQVLAWDAALAQLAADGSWLAREIRTFQARTLCRVDNMARSMFALLEEGHAFTGLLFELALAADRSYMFLDEDEENVLRLGPANAGGFEMASGRTRLATRYIGEPDKVAEVLDIGVPINAEDAEELGLVTLSPDDIDWDDEVRIAVEERVSLSPDALTGMEQNLRFAGQETCETRIYGRLSAWQNWIFQRPNAVGDRGALTLYGHPEQPVFDYKRT